MYTYQQSSSTEISNQCLAGSDGLCAKVLSCDFPVRKSAARRGNEVLLGRSCAAAPIGFCPMHI